MIKHILVPVDGSPLDERALTAGFELGLLFGGHVDVLHVRPDPQQDMPFIGDGFPPEMLENMVTEAERSAQSLSENARRAFDGAVIAASAGIAEHPADGDRITAWWREALGRPDRTISREGRFADLVVFAQAPAHPARAPMLQAALFDTGRPVLLASAATTNEAFPSVVIAWDGSRPAVRAVAAAMPFLHRATTVTILTVELVADETTGEHGTAPVPEHATRLAEHLAWHGIDAVTLPVRRYDHSVGETLAAKAAELGAGLLVMGGYGHSRLRELVLGGATRHMLGTPLTCSVFMAH